MCAVSFAFRMSIHSLKFFVHNIPGRDGIHFATYLMSFASYTYPSTFPLNKHAFYSQEQFQIVSICYSVRLSPTCIVELRGIPGGRETDRGNWLEALPSCCMCEGHINMADRCTQVITGFETFIGCKEFTVRENPVSWS
jgi:hypothetical protein